MKSNAWSAKKKMVLAAVLVGAVLSILTLFFVRDVEGQLWEQSVETIMESTQQGCSTLKIQLRNAYESMETAAGHVKNFSSGQRDGLERILGGYALADESISLYLPDGTCIPAGAQADEEVEEMLAAGYGNEAAGIIDPHISSVTGANVFDLFVAVGLKDGTRGYLVKEYEVGNIVDSFSLSFYHDSGFSYVVNTEGDVLIRSPHPNSNKTVQNLFDILSASQNDPESLARFAQALENSDTGWAVFDYQDQETVFCYTPLGLQSDWYFMSIIPTEVVNAQTNEILQRSMVLIFSIILGIFLLIIFYFHYANKANKKLKNQAEYIGYLYNAVPEGIALIGVEYPYYFLQLNREGLRLLGFQEPVPEHALDGKCLRDVICPDDYERMEALFRETAGGGQKSIFEVRVQKETGDFFWAAGIVEKTLDDSGTPVFITAIHDITGQKLAEEEREREKLQERHTLVGAISNAYPIIISINLTQDTVNFIYVKSGLMLGLGKQKTYGELFEEMKPTFHSDHEEEFVRRFAPQNLRRTLGEEKNEVFLEAKQMLADGKYHWTSTQIIYVNNPYSGDKLAILISRRIDEQRYEEQRQREALQSALERAKAASDAKSSFLSNMSHDIRTPMNAIVGMTAIASNHTDDPERVRECLKKIDLSSRHLLSLINDILDMSKIENGKLSLREESFNLANLATDAVELVYPQVEEKRLEMNVRIIRMQNEAVIGDPLRIRQVYINILSNSVKYTPEGGSIRVELWQEKCMRTGYQNYVFRCADTGVGMDEEFLTKLFQPFERSQDSTSSRIAGTGLGMAITKNIIDLMNGDIQVESCPGRGTVFTVTLPLRPQDAQQEQAPEEWKGMRSLIVDDDLQTCESVAELLEEIGLRTHFVTTGTAAVECVAEAKNTSDPYGLVIADWKMPGMDGVETARRIRKEIGPEIPIVVLTAYDWIEIENDARSAGVTAFMSKPLYRSKLCYLFNELSGERNPLRQIGLADSFGDYSGKRVLLVEDNVMNREIARTLLEEMGTEVEQACDGEEAVEKVAKSGEGYYDLVLMDIQMPRMDGYEAAKAIRAMDRTDVKKLPIIAMTANAFDEDVRAALRAGMNGHFPKPFDVNKLKELLYHYLIKKPDQDDRS